MVALMKLNDDELWYLIGLIYKDLRLACHYNRMDLAWRKTLQDKLIHLKEMQNKNKAVLENE